MSVREEDRRKNNCTSRGLGLAAAAIGVGVGAALYYFFSKRPENPDTEGSTSENWSCEQPPSLIITTQLTTTQNNQQLRNLEYTTVSEHTTTDTSIWLSDNSNSNRSLIKLQKKHMSSSDCSSSNSSSVNSSSANSTSLDICNSESSNSADRMDSSFEEYEESSCYGCDCSNCSSVDSQDEYSVTDTDTSSEQSEDSSEEEENSDASYSNSDANDSSLETGYVTLRTTSSHSYNNRTNESSDSDENEWDITNSSADVPTDTRSFITSPFLRSLVSLIGSPRPQNDLPAEDEHTRVVREQTFRERRWSLEECAICFEVMLKDQPLMQLPCTHNFHVACIGPWLQEHQTCPMCRKAAE